MYFTTITHQCCLGTLALISGIIVSGINAEHNRFKRETSADCKDKYKVIPQHTICLAKSKDASNSGVDDQQKKAIVDLHNELRAIPNATNMLKLEWDDEIAAIAQHWADSCNTEHDSGAQRSIPGTFSLGQNLAMNAKSWSAAIQLWYDEVKLFTFAGENDFHAVGHYTQLVWANSHRIGCGYADCPNTKYYVCNYGPGGNAGNYTTPYKQGKKCAECPGCTNNLCDCPSPCLNGGSLNRMDCSCTCKHDFYIAEEHCSLNCSNVEEDPWYCAKDYGKQDCMLINEDCPNKCKVCPYGGVGYIETGWLTPETGGCCRTAQSHAAVLLAMVLIARNMLSGF